MAAASRQIFSNKHGSRLFTYFRGSNLRLCPVFTTDGRNMIADALSRCYCVQTNTNQEYDMVIVGGGIVGMATAQELIERYPTLKFGSVEKESKLAAHQSGHNSGVIHAGVYYTPGSLKAKLCVEGLHLSYKYCDKHNIPYKKCGKLIVAVNEGELSGLQALFERGQKNNVPELQVVGPEKIKELEPHCLGIKALWSPHTGIVDWAEVNRSYGRVFESKGGKIHLNFKVEGFKMLPEDKHGENKYPLMIQGNNGQTLRCRYVVICGGLYSDKLAEMSGCSSNPKIVPFRGEYLLLKPNKCHLINGNIYPVPNPKFPFLGVHFTPRMDGSVWLGPNAVLAFKREGYKFSDFNLFEFLDTIRFRGFQKLVGHYLVFGAGEMYRSFFIGAQVRLLQAYVPEITVKDVTRGPAGVRAQAMSKDGSLVEDFVFDDGKGELGERTLHVRNAPSPAATSSLAIAKMVADKAQAKFKL